MHSLLSHLPLLRPGNTEAKAEYLKLIPKILEDSIDRGCDIEESRQLLSYSLIHPAINSDERNQLNLWLGQLEERVTSFNIYQQGRLNQADLSDLSHAMSYMDNHGSSSSQNGLNAFNSGGHQQGVQVQQQVPTSINGWQSSAPPRDAALIVTDPDMHPAMTSSSTSSTAGVGRPIKAATTSGCHVNSNNALVNSSNSSLIPQHTPLHATNSGPPSFNSSQQGMCFNFSCRFHAQSCIKKTK